jgi:outer membrane protein assembly factor BamB
MEVKLKHFLIFVYVFAIYQNLFSQIHPELDWYRKYNGPVNSYDFLTSMKIDNTGIYLAGGSFMYDSTADAILIKYSSEGDSILSIIYSLQPDVRDEFNSLAIDNNSDLYLTGLTTINNYYKKMIFQKYSKTGQLNWSRDFNFKARGLIVLLDTEDKPTLAYDNWEGPNYAHLVINGFDSSGDSLWSVIFRDDTSAYGIAGMVRDNDNYFYVGVLQLQIIGGQHIFHSYVACIKDGSLIWNRPIQEGSIRNIILDKENNVVVFTKYESGVYKINSATGEIIWEKNINNSINFIQYLYQLDNDEDNNILLTGNNSNTDADIQILKLSSTGDEIWFKEYNSQTNDIPTAIAVDVENNIYIAGLSADSALTTFVLKFSTLGELKWEYNPDEIAYDQLILYPIIVKDSSLFIGGGLNESVTMTNIFVMKLDQKLGTGIYSEYPVLNIYDLEQNYPNPFNPSTTIRYEIPELSFVTLKIYDVLGNEVATLVEEEKQTGKYETEFNAVNLPSGIYFYRLQTGSFVETKKMILLK